MQRGGGGGGGGRPRVPSVSGGASQQSRIDSDDDRSDEPSTSAASQSRSRGGSAAGDVNPFAAAFGKKAAAVAPQRQAVADISERMREERNTRGAMRREQESDEEDEDEYTDEEEFTEDEEEYEEDVPAGDMPQRKYKQPRLKFDLDTFTDGFDTGAFVSDLTRDLFEQQDPQDFDPAPFSTLFDSALERLNALRDETDGRITQYAEQCKRDEEIHKENLVGLQEQMGAVLAQFSRLDSRISSVAHTAVRIGHTLQTVDAAKRNNLQGQEIIAHFLAFNQGSADKLPAIYSTTDPVELHRAAELIQMLSNISQDLRVKGTERATELIARTSNNIENQLIARFDHASSRQNHEEMKVCAATLLNFRGRSLIKRYVFNVIESLEAYASNKAAEAASPTHRNRTASVEDSAYFQQALQSSEAMDDKSLVGAFRVSLLRFYRGVSLSMKEQVTVCAVVFPQPLAIIKAILERVFQDKIQGLVDAGLGDRRLTTEEYLRCLEFAHKHTVELVAGLQAAIRGMSGGGGHSSSLASLSAAASASSSNGETVSMMNLADQVGGIFASYREAYFSREMQLITQVCEKNITDTLAMESPRGAPDPQQDTDLFGRVKKNVLQDQRQKWALLVLEYPLVDRLIQQCTLSLSRCDKLSDPLLLSEHASTIFLHVAQAVYEGYLQPVLDVAMESLPPPEPKTEPDPFFFQTVGLINLVADKLTLHHQHWVMQRISTNPNTQVVCDNRLRELTGKLESQLVLGLSRCLQAALKYAARILSSKQRSVDYRPRDDDSDALMDGKPSAACEALCAFIHAQYEAVVTCLDGKNLDKFLLIFGLKLHDVLVAHLQKYTISTMGASLIARDMKLYQQAVGQFHITAVVDAFSTIRQLCDLFFVDSSNLKAVINDSPKLGTLDHAYLLSWIAMRSDFDDNRKKILAALNFKDTDANSPEPASRERATS